MPALEQGAVIGGRYVIDSVGPIAQGTYAHVYRAVDREIEQKVVAVKAQILLSKDLQSLLRTEAEMLRQLQRRPGIPAYVDYFDGNEDVGGGFLVMELLGQDLGCALSQLRRLTPFTAAFLGLQMLQSLKAIHDEGYLHRDVKPNNFVLGRGKRCLRVYIIDFGLTRRHLEPDGSPRAPRKTCDFRGTTRYASVAAQRQEDQGRVDDLWSLVYALVEMCTGGLPWGFYRSKAGLNAAEKAEAKKKVLEEKLRFTARVCQQTTKPTGYLAEVPAPLLEFIRVLSKLEYADLPDYARLASILKKVGTEEERRRAAEVDLVTKLKRKKRPPGSQGVGKCVEAPACPGLDAASRNEEEAKRRAVEAAERAAAEGARKGPAAQPSSSAAALQRRPPAATSAWAVAARRRYLRRSRAFKVIKDVEKAMEELFERQQRLLAALTEALGDGVPADVRALKRRRSEQLPQDSTRAGRSAPPQ